MTYDAESIRAQVQFPVLLWVWLQFELVCDASINLSLLFTRRRLANTVRMASLDVEMMKSCGWRGEGRTSGMVSKVGVDIVYVRACVNA